MEDVVGGAARGRMVDSRRARILQATVEVVAERGYAHATIGLVVTRARVSRRTFDRLFTGLEDCLATVFDLGLERTMVLVGEAFEREETWQDGLRMALASLLVFLDRERLLTRVWLVESLAAGPWAVEHRERNLQVVRELVLSGWPASERWSLPPLAAEGVIASILGIMHTHIVTGRPEPLIELLGPLMGLVSGPYLSRGASAREVELGEQLAREIQAGEHPLGLSGEQPNELAGAWSGGPFERYRGGLSAEHRDDPGQPQRRPPTRSHVTIPMVLSNPNAHRARQCLLFLDEHPDASNREVSAGIGVAHQSQISKLLRYLVEENLVAKNSQGTGQRNAWRLTPLGKEILRALPPG